MDVDNSDWKERKKIEKANMQAMQNLPYEIKKRRAALRIEEYIMKLDDMDLTAHVSVGGLDSIVLLARRYGRDRNGYKL